MHMGHYYPERDAPQAAPEKGPVHVRDCKLRCRINAQQRAYTCVIEHHAEQQHRRRSYDTSRKANGHKLFLGKHLTPWLLPFYGKKKVAQRKTNALSNRFLLVLFFRVRKKRPLLLLVKVPNLMMFVKTRP